MRILAFLLLCGAAFGQCGVERKAVKTLQDGAVLDFVHVKPTTIASLVAMPGHGKAELLTMNATRFPFEDFVYSVDAKIVGFKKEGDQDFHVVIKDDNDRTMIVEIPSPKCAPSRAKQFQALRDGLEAKAGKATTAFKTLDPPLSVTILGVGFFDFVHGQTGHAPNGIELHPVLAITYR